MPNQITVHCPACGAPITFSPILRRVESPTVSADGVSKVNVEFAPTRVAHKCQDA